MRGEDEEARFEVREAGVVFAEKVNAGEEEALDFVGFEHRAAAAGELHRRQAVSGHRRKARFDVVLKVAAIVLDFF